MAAVGGRGAKGPPVSAVDRVNARALLPPPQYITVGSYGTNEGVTLDWIDQWAGGAPDPTSYLYQSCPPKQPSNFNPPPYAPTAPGQWGVGGRCIAPKIADSGVWCPSAQPAYSRWREHAYGVGMLDILSPTKAVWAFYSQESAMVKPVDEVVITRADPSKCATSTATIAAAQTTGVSLDSIYMGTKLNVTAAKASLLAGGGNQQPALGVSVDPKGAAAGLASSAAAWVGSKMAIANHSVIALTSNGGPANKTAGSTFVAFGK